VFVDVFVNVVEDVDVETDLTMPVEKLEDCVELAVTWVRVGVEDCVVFFGAAISSITLFES
jgi:hypothetical protein